MTTPTRAAMRSACPRQLQIPILPRRRRNLRAHRTERVAQPLLGLVARIRLVENLQPVYPLPSPKRNRRVQAFVRDEIFRQISLAKVHLPQQAARNDAAMMHGQIQREGVRAIDAGCVAVLPDVMPHCSRLRRVAERWPDVDVEVMGARLRLNAKHQDAGRVGIAFHNVYSFPSTIRRPLTIRRCCTANTRASAES